MLKMMLMQFKMMMLQLAVGLLMVLNLVLLKMVVQLVVRLLMVLKVALLKMIVLPLAMGLVPVLKVVNCCLVMLSFCNIFLC